MDLVSATGQAGVGLPQLHHWACGVGMTLLQVYFHRFSAPMSSGTDPLLSGKQRLALLDQRYRAGVTVDGHEPAAGDPLCRITGAHDGGDAVLPGEDGAVGGGASNVGDQASRLGKQRGPRGRGRRAHEYAVGPHCREVCRR
jgi:hypothetical protein